MAGNNNSFFLRQLEQLAEVTSAAPSRVWKCPHTLQDTDAGSLQTPTRNHLLPPFSTDDIRAKSNNIKNSPDEPSKANAVKPCDKVSSPSLARNSSFPPDGIRFQSNEIEKSPEPPEAHFIQSCEEASPCPARKRSIPPFPADGVLPKIIKIEESPGPTFSPSPARNLLPNPKQRTMCGREKRASTPRVLSKSKKIGSRVYARWNNGQFYWGMIRKITEKNGSPQYSIQFDDGDVSSVSRKHIYSEFEYFQDYGLPPPYSNRSAPLNLSDFGAEQSPEVCRTSNDLDDPTMIASPWSSRVSSSKCLALEDSSFSESDLCKSKDATSTKSFDFSSKTNVMQSEKDHTPLSLKLPSMKTKSKDFPSKTNVMQVEKVETPLSLKLPSLNTIGDTAKISQNYWLDEQDPDWIKKSRSCTYLNVQSNHILVQNETPIMENDRNRSEAKGSENKNIRYSLRWNPNSTAYRVFDVPANSKQESSPWTAEEQDTLLTAYLRHKNNWNAVAKSVSTRTETACRMKLRDLHLVKEIVGHRPSSKENGYWDLRIRWLYWGPKYDTWEPFAQKYDEEMSHLLVKEYINRHPDVDFLKARKDATSWIRSNEAHCDVEDGSFSEKRGGNSTAKNWMHWTPEEVEVVSEAVQNVRGVERSKVACRDKFKSLIKDGKKREDARRINLACQGKNNTTTDGEKLQTRHSDNTRTDKLEWTEIEISTLVSSRENQKSWKMVSEDVGEVGAGRTVKACGEKFRSLKDGQKAKHRRVGEESMDSLQSTEALISKPCQGNQNNWFCNFFPVRFFEKLKK